MNRALTNNSGYILLVLAVLAGIVLPQLQPGAAGKLLLVFSAGMGLLSGWYIYFTPNIKQTVMSVVLTLLITASAYVLIVAIALPSAQSFLFVTDVLFSSSVVALGTLLGLFASGFHEQKKTIEKNAPTGSQQPSTPSVPVQEANASLKEILRVKNETSEELSRLKTEKSRLVSDIKRIIHTELELINRYEKENNEFFVKKITAENRTDL